MELVLTNLSLIALGGCLGSFASMLIYRLPLEDVGITIFKPRSFCPLCKNKLTILQLIPFVGYVYSQGICKTCNAKINSSYLINEVLIAAFVLLLLLGGIAGQFASDDQSIHVTGIVKGEGADDAGMLPWDTIETIQGEDVVGLDGFRDIVEQYNAGDSVLIGVLHLSLIHI